MKTYYMHTMDGRPSYFSKRDRLILLMTFNGRDQRLAKTLKQIRREQRIDAKECGGDGPSISMSYRRVAVPD